MTSPRLPSLWASEIVGLWTKGGFWTRLFDHQLREGDLPHVDALKELLDAVFFSSLEKEEGRSVRFSVGLGRPDRLSAHRIEPLPLEVESLRKLSAACEWDATVLLTWFVGGKWMIWGVTTNDVPLTRGQVISVGAEHLVLTARGPGSLLLRWRHEVLFSYSSGRGTVFDETNRQDEIIKLIASALPSDAARIKAHHLSAIYRSMRGHGRGGALLVVPNDAPTTIKFKYSTRTQPGGLPGPFAGAVAHELQWDERLRNKAKEEVQQSGANSKEHFQQLYQSTIRATEAEAALIGRLTAIDGIVVVNHEMNLLGFGGKIVPGDFGSTVVLVIDPRDGRRTPSTVKEVFSGMRHISAAMICRQCHGALALVQSQDGSLTIIVHRPDGELWVIRPLERLVPVLELATTAS